MRKKLKLEKRIVLLSCLAINRKGKLKHQEKIMETLTNRENTFFMLVFMLFIQIKKNYIVKPFFASS